MWAHQRAVSTAFLRMMIERGDVTVVHEPLVTLTDEGVVPLPDGPRRHRLGAALGRASVLATWPRWAANARCSSRTRSSTATTTCSTTPRRWPGSTHTFIVRDPRQGDQLALRA